TGMLCAPLAGLAVGLCAAAVGGVSLFLGGGALLAAVATAAIPAVLTRGLHLDGLADTADGLGSGKPSEDALRIMKRSDIGPFGVITLLFVLLGQVAALAELFRDRARMATLLDGAPAGAAAVLAKLTWGPPYGEASVTSPTPPVGWLLDRALLLPSGPRNVVLPREVALHLRHGRAHRAPEPFAPPLSPTTEHDPQVVDNTAAGQTFTALATVEELLGQWETAGPPVLRAGGLSVRDLKRTAVALDVSEPVAAFWIELAYAAGLVASDGETDERYAPTPAYDDWLRLPAEQRWARLAAAWLPATRTSGLVGGRDSRGRTLAALGPELDRSPAPEVRRRVLELLA
ncbi:adenosylcobinamide-GDP ribazoletransferase, partial [Streptomyces albiflaviniger]|nr:adenosylcobinamide-GDP ribazoletransferase [Streptomyces albiflaviniger]